MNEIIYGPQVSVLDENLVVIGEHKVSPNDLGLIESLRQRGYEVSFQDVPVFALREPESVDVSADQPGKVE